MLDVLCHSGSETQFVPASSGKTWISCELHAVQWYVLFMVVYGWTEGALVR